MSYRNQSETQASPWPALAVTSFAVFAAALDATVLFVAFPDIRASFPQVSLAELSWVLNAYTIVFAALLIPMGRLADRLGRRRVFSAGVLVFTVGSALSGLAPSVGLLIVFRIVQAIGAATVVPASLALVLGAFPQSRRSAAVGIWAAVGAVAAALGPSLGAVVVEAASWRWTLFLNIPLGVLTLLAIPRVLTESRDPDATPPAITGVALLVAGVAALALGIVQGDEWGWSDARTLAALTAALILISAFNQAVRQIGGVFGVAAVVALLTAANTRPELLTGFSRVFLMVAAGGGRDRRALHPNQLQTNTTTRVAEVTGEASP